MYQKLFDFEGELELGVNVKVWKASDIKKTRILAELKDEEEWSCTHCRDTAIEQLPMNQLRRNIHLDVW